MTDECPICSEAISAATGRVSLSCGHEFHFACVARWYQKPDGSAGCPCCRREPSEHERLVSFSEDDSTSVSTDSILQRDDLTPLMRAVRENDHDGVTALLASAVDVNVVDSDGDTALAYASTCAGEDTRILEQLLDAGADIDNQGEHGYTALTWATANHKVPAALLLIRRGADVTRVTSKGHSALSIASSEGLTEVVRAVLASGHVTEGGRALLFAAHYGHKECVKALLDAGVDVNVRDSADRTPLMLAMHNTSDVELVELLLRRGANASAYDAEGWNCLLYLADNDEREPMMMATLFDHATRWVRQRDGRWGRVMETWGDEDGGPVPPGLMEMKVGAATKIQTMWRRRYLAPSSAIS